MADSQPTKKRRLVKNPETFRERAVKASEVADKPSRRGRARNGIAWLLRPVFGPIARFIKRFWLSKPLKPLRKVLHWIGLVIFPHYFRNSWHELKFVSWPSWKQSWRLTYAVLIFAVVFGAAIAVVDYGLDKVFKHILLK